MATVIGIACKTADPTEGEVSVQKRLKATYALWLNYFEDMFEIIGQPCFNRSKPLIGSASNCS